MFKNGRSTEERHHIASRFKVPLLQMHEVSPSFAGFRPLIGEVRVRVWVVRIQWIREVDHNLAAFFHIEMHALQLASMLPFTEGDRSRTAHFMHAPQR